MNYSKKAVLSKKKQLTSSYRRIISKCTVFSFRMILVLIVAVMICGTAATFGILKGIIDNAPSIDTIEFPLTDIPQASMMPQVTLPRLW